MMERADATAALFAEILADPRSEAARLVYADHLIEHGDPRGELIQLQCRLEHVAWDDPDRRTLARRVADLLGQHESAWTRDVRGLGFDDHLHQVTLRRGFVEKVTITAAQHAVIPALRALTPLREVHLRVRDGAALAPLGEALAEVEAISMHAASTEARRAFAAAFARWPHTGRIRQLHVAGPEVVDVIASAPALAGLETLRVMSLARGLGALAAAPHLSTVKTLELPRATIGHEGAGLLAGSRVLANVTRLQVEGGSIDAAAGRALAGAAFAPNLVQLRIHENVLGPDGTAALVARCTALELLDLEATDLGEDGLRAVLAASGLARLRSLDVSRNRLDDRALARGFAALQLPALRHLVCRHNVAAARATAALAAAPRLAELRSLDLSDNALADPGVTALAESAHLRALEVLRLASTGVAAGALRALAAGALAPRLRTLDLGRNLIGDAGIAALVDGDRFGSLGALHLDDANLTGRGVEALAASSLVTRLEHLVITGLRPGALATLFAAGMPELRTLVADAFDDEAAVALAAARGLPRLHDLVLTARGLTDAGVRALVDAPGLREISWLELDAPAVTDLGRTLLRQRFGHHAAVFAGASLQAFAALGRRI